MTGYAGPAPHPWNEQADRTIGLVAWVALALLLCVALVSLMWNAMSASDGGTVAPAGVSSAECLQTGGRMVEQAGGGSVCVWPAGDY